MLKIKAKKNGSFTFESNNIELELAIFNFIKEQYDKDLLNLEDLSFDNLKESFNSFMDEVDGLNEKQVWSPVKDDDESLDGVVDQIKKVNTDYTYGSLPKVDPSKKIKEERIGHVESDAEKNRMKPDMDLLHRGTEQFFKDYKEIRDREKAEENQGDIGSLIKLKEDTEKVRIEREKKKEEEDRIKSLLKSDDRHSALKSLIDRINNMDDEDEDEEY